MVKAIYFAGKVNPPNDWRESIISREMLYLSSGISGATYSSDAWKPRYIHLGTGKEIIYSGPYLVDGNPYGCPCLDMFKVHKLCLSSIDSSDIVFAWIDDLTAYETFAELGYAKAKGKTIWIAGLDLREPCYKKGEPCGKAGNDLPYIYMLADKRMIGGDGLTPVKALLSFVTPKFDSPIEEMFWNAWETVSDDHGIIVPLIPQYQIGRYRVDFAHEPSKTVIELDGHATHSSPDAIARDRKRQREIDATGWKVIRYGGKEITSDAYSCALEVYDKLLPYHKEMAPEQPKLKSPVKPDKLDQERRYTSSPVSFPSLTIEEVNNCLDSIKRRVESRKNGVKTSAFLKYFSVVGIEGTKEHPVIILRTDVLFAYKTLSEDANHVHQPSLEWATKIELKQECKFRFVKV